MIEAGRNIPVLIVEDIDNMRTTIANMLQKIGFVTVFQAKHGKEALTCLEVNKVGLIISDINMPVLGGIELLEIIRKNSEHNHIPFVIISSVVHHHVVNEAIKMGVSQFIAKPFSQNILENRLLKALSSPVKIPSKQFLAAKSQARESLPSEPIIEEKLSILVVDDVPENIHIISNILKKDFNIRAATSGALALKICQSDTPPDLMLLDIMMPEMDGFEVMRQLARYDSSNPIKVIFLSASSENDNIVTGFELGAVDYITKPISTAVLKVRVNTHINAIKSARAANIQIESMIDSMKVREDFEQIMQHDLKNHLQVINHSIHSIRKNIKNANHVDSTLNSMESGSLLMSQLIDNMMIIHQIENGQYQFNPELISLAEIIDTIMVMNNVSVKDHHLEVLHVIEGLGEIWAEPLLTQSIINNLYRNAIQAAPRGSAIKISVETRVDWVVLDIHNIGTIPSELRDTFFNKYMTHGKKGGKGIGTYAVKLMTEIQKGEVSFESDPKNGTTLSVKFLAQAPSEY